MVSILRIEDEDDLEDAVKLADAMLRSGGTMVYPTDTVYGLGCDATSETAVKKVFAIKKSERKPLSVMIADFGMIDDYCDTGIWEDVILRRYLPGPYTFILKKRAPIAASLTDTLAIRIPDSEFCQLLCERFGKPIITTSANLTGQSAPTKIEEVGKSLTDAVGLAIDAGETKYRGPSLIVDLVARKLIRPGGETISLVEEIAGY